MPLHNNQRPDDGDDDDLVSAGQRLKLILKEHTVSALYGIIPLYQPKSFQHHQQVPLKPFLPCCQV